jgi:hypothetical protein
VGAHPGTRAAWTAPRGAHRPPRVRVPYKPDRPPARRVEPDATGRPVRRHAPDQASGTAVAAQRPCPPPRTVVNAGAFTTAAASGRRSAHRPGQECGEEVSAPLVANREAPVGQQPRQRPFHLRMVAAPAGCWTATHVRRSAGRSRGAGSFGSSGRRSPCRRAAWLGAGEAVRDGRPRAAPAAGSRRCWPPTTPPPTALRWRRSAGGTWSLACPGQLGSRQRCPPRRAGH